MCRPRSVRFPLPCPLTKSISEIASAGHQAPVLGAPGADSRPEPPAIGPPASAEAPRPLVRPLSADRYEIHFTASAGTRDYLRRAQDLLSHAVPSGDLDRQRDGDRCAWVAPNGHRCGERRYLQFHHDDPWAAGGKPTVERVRLLCWTHNDHEAGLFYGPGHRRRGADVVSEPLVGYGSLTSALPVLGRVNESVVPHLERRGPRERVTDDRHGQRKAERLRQGGPSNPSALAAA
jgi:hypothetical protein